MLAAVFAATLALAPAQASDDMTRSVLNDVCLPYVNGESADMAAAELLGFSPGDGEGEYATADQAFSLRIETTGTAEDGDLTRVCILQVRRGGLAAVREGATASLRSDGFTPEDGQPDDRPIWNKGGVTVSLRQNPGRAAIMRVSYSAIGA
jgi:hypothetical protein